MRFHSFSHREFSQFKAQGKGSVRAQESAFRSQVRRHRLGRSLGWCAVFPVTTCTFIASHCSFDVACERPSDYHSGGCCSFGSPTNVTRNVTVLCIALLRCPPQPYNHAHVRLYTLATYVPSGLNDG